MRRKAFPLMLNTVNLPTASAEGNTCRTSNRLLHRAFLAMRYQTSRGAASSACTSAASKSFLRLMTCKSASLLLDSHFANSSRRTSRFANGRIIRRKRRHCRKSSQEAGGRRHDDRHRFVHPSKCGGLRVATERLLLRVEHEEDAEDDHEKGPEAREGQLPARGQLRQSFDEADAESGDGETQVLGLDVSHDRHVVRAMHAGVVLMKQKQHRTKASEYRKQPCGPGRFQNAAGALDLDNAESQENYGKRLVLHILGIVSETVPPALRAEGPQLRVAEDEQKQPGKQKASRPGKAKEG